MADAALELPMTLDQFLPWEAEQPDRHEFVDGEIFAMSGAEERHVSVTGNVFINGGIGCHGLRACVSWRSIRLWGKARWRMFRHGLNVDPPTKQRNLTRCATGSR